MERECPVLMWAAVRAMVLLVQSMQDFFGGRWDLLDSVVGWVSVPIVLLPSKLLGDPEFEVGERCVPGPECLVGGLAN